MTFSDELLSGALDMEINMTTKTDAARECAEESILQPLYQLAYRWQDIAACCMDDSKPTEKSAANTAGICSNELIGVLNTIQRQHLRPSLTKHFPPAQESGTRSGCVPVSKLEDCIQRLRTRAIGLENNGFRKEADQRRQTANEIEALIAEAKS
jgi:hypothetical protein